MLTQLMGAVAESDDNAMPTAYGVIWTSPNGRDQWKPLLPKDVPEWLRDNPVHMRHLVNGEDVMNPRADAKDWYRFEALQPANNQAVH